MTAAPSNAELKSDVDEVIEAIVYLYTESRRLTKELARRADLTGPQLTVVKILEQIGDLFEYLSNFRVFHARSSALSSRTQRP